LSFKKSIAKTLKASFGNIIEWYDYSLYGYFAIVISQNFFPEETSRWESLLLTFGIFATGYLARPLGSVIFGSLGDQKGRYYAMNLSILLMAIPTIVMAFIPTYESIGIFAPIILIIIRVFQGISAGGQFGNLMTIESEGQDFRFVGFNVSLAFSTSILGFILASAVSAIFTTIIPESWGTLVWRIPFGLGAVLLFIFIFLRGKDEGHIPRNYKKPPIKELVKSYKKHLFIVTAIATLALMIYYIDITYMTSYMVEVLGMSMSDALVINTIATVFMFLITPFFGFISDLFGRKQVLFLSFLLCLVASPVLLMFLDGKSMVVSVVILASLATITGMIQGAANPCYTMVFPHRVRASGASITYGFGASVSGFAPLIATFITGVMDHTLGIILLISVLSFLGAIITLKMPLKQMRVRRLNDLKANNIIKQGEKMNEIFYR
jgi:MHS family proline/betaine transporter-like MFS transporter